MKGYVGWAKVDPAAANAAASLIIKNTYRTLMTRGMKGCFVFATDPLIREYLRKAMS